MNQCFVQVDDGAYFSGRIRPEQVVRTWSHLNIVNFIRNQFSTSINDAGGLFKARFFKLQNNIFKFHSQYSNYRAFVVEFLAPVLGPDWLPDTDPEALTLVNQ